MNQKKLEGFHWRWSHAWPLLKAKAKGELINEVQLLSNLRDELDFQLNLGSEHQKRSVDHLVSSIMTGMARRISMPRPAHWTIAPYERQPGQMRINFLYLKNALDSEKLSADELASLITSNGVSKTKYTTSLGSPPPKGTPTNATRLRSYDPFASTKISPRYDVNSESSKRNCEQAIFEPSDEQTSSDIDSELVSCQGMNDLLRSSELDHQDPTKRKTPALERFPDLKIYEAKRPSATTRRQNRLQQRLQNACSKVESCGNCNREGHTVRDCIGPVDEQGFIAACPYCNCSMHNYDNCSLRRSLTKVEQNAIDEELLLYYRQNKPSIRTQINWVELYNERHPLLISLPWLPGFALKQQKLADGFKSTLGSHEYDHSWQNYSYEFINNPDKEARHRMKDPHVDDLAKRSLVLAKSFDLEL